MATCKFILRANALKGVDIFAINMKGLSREQLIGELVPWRRVMSLYKYISHPNDHGSRPWRTKYHLYYRS